MEAGESPWQACRRELIEEIGFAPAIGRLLSVVHALDRESDRESIQFVFDGGECGERHVALNPEELSEHRFITARSIDDCLVPALGNRVRHASDNLGGGLDACADLDTMTRYRSM